MNGLWTKIMGWAALGAGLLGGASAARADWPPVPEATVTSITAAMPKAAPAVPRQARKVLVFTRCTGFRHDAVPTGAKMLEIMGRQTGAFEATVSEDPMMFEPARLAAFDAVVMDNTTGNELFLPEGFKDLPEAKKQAARQTEARLKKSLVDFVAGGKGLVGIHAATDCFYDWPTYGVMMGAYFDGHPWTADKTVRIKIDEPEHALNAPFKGQGFDVTDEIYQFKEPYSREALRVILSLDPQGTDMTLPGIKRTDGDFAVSWLHTFDKGRVFYCSLGHNQHIFWTPAILEHYLRGIQFALGDLEADATTKKTMTLGTSDAMTTVQ